MSNYLILKSRLHSADKMVMEFFKPKPTVPVDRRSFRKSTFLHLLFQSSLIVALIVFINSRFAEYGYSLYLICTGVVLLSFIISMYLKRFDYKGRFKDIYPEHELSGYALVMMAFVPFIQFSLTLLLLTKESKSASTPWKCFYRIPHLFLVIIPYIAIQIFSPRLSYWIGNPSLYFVLETAYSAEKVIELKELTEKQTVESAFDEYLRSKKRF